MNSKEALEKRLSDLGNSLDAKPDALALLGLGSAGLERDRLDAWSDLDFFLIVAEKTKSGWLEDTKWLDSPCPVDYLFRNTPDGFKLLWQDGIFGEMAVFEASELQGIPFSEGRVIWARQDFETGVLKPRNLGGRKWMPTSLEYLAGELLTCLYVGMCRWKRGEKLSAWKFIQGHCVERFIEMTELTNTPMPVHEDPYNRDRRFEFRYPLASGYLPAFITGYELVPDSALALLDWLESTMPVNHAMAHEIRMLCS